MGAAAPAAGPAAGAGAVLRWAVCTAAWAPEGAAAGAEWAFLLGLLPEGERRAVMRFVRFEDQQRALVSRLLQRACASRAAGLAWGAVDLRRTKGGKPFLATAHGRPGLPNFNFNVSHEGHYVVLASEPVCIVGVDVAAPDQVRSKGRALSDAELQATFRRQLSDREWEAVLAGEGGVQDAFRRHWSCKEAFVKARGDGLGFELGRAEFEFHGGPDAFEASVAVAGRLQPKWTFFVQRLGEHWVTVARGPPEDVVDAHGVFKGTLGRTEFDAAEWSRELRAPSPPFALMELRDLVPEDRRDEYCARFQDDPF